VEEAGDVDRQVVVVVGLGEFDERLRDEDPGVVDQRVDAPKKRQASRMTRSAVAGSAMSPATARTSGAQLGAIDRELATTR
jgi:hypothetical protein